MPNHVPANFFNGSSPVALVAGGAGFIGSYVCRALLEKNVKVICLDNWSTGLKENIKDFENNKNFVLLARDITKKLPDEIERLDYVLHLAGIEAYLNGEDVSIETLEANSVGTKNLLDVALKFDARFLLASTIYVYTGRISSVSTNSYFGESRAEEGKLSHNEAKRFAEALTGEYGQKKNLDARIVRIGDAYGPKMTLATNSLLARIFKQAAYYEQIVLPSHGDSKIYPIYVDDIVSGIIKVLFSSGLKNSVVTLLGEKKTLLEIASIVKQVGLIQQDIAIDPSIKVADLSNEVQQLIETERVEQQNKFLWQEKISLSEGIEKTLRWFYASVQPKAKIVEKTDEQTKPVPVEEQNLWEEQKTVEIKPSETEPIKTKMSDFFDDIKGIHITKPKTNRYTVVVWGLLIGLVLWFFILPFIELGVALFELSRAKAAFVNTDSSKALIWSKGAEGWFKASESGFSNWQYIPLIKTSGLSLASKNAQLSEVAKIAGESAGVLADAKNLFGGVTGHDSFDSTHDAQKIALDLKSLEEKIGFLQAEIGDQEISIKLPFLKKFVALQSGDLVNARHAADGANSLMDSVPALTGVAGKKVYLLLIEDSSELRPGGGVITGYGLATFEKGHLINVEIQDVSVADNQLKGRVDPPGTLKQFLNIQNWKLKDSNWSSDFPTNAARAAWFVEKELGVKVNGVISLDTQYFKNVAQRTGSITLSDTGEKITASAIEGKLLQARDKNASFLPGLTRGLIKDVVEHPDKNMGGFVRGTVDSLETRHLLIWTDNNQANESLTRIGWDGSAKKTACSTDPNLEKNCLADYLQVVDANIGLNTANLFTRRSYSLEMNVEKDKVTHRLTIHYQNSKVEGQSVDYKNYLRIYTSADSNLNFATLINLGTQEDLKVDQTKEKDKNVYSTVITIPSESSRDVVLVWETANSHNIENGGNLVFLWQKQPGVGEDSVDLKISLPDDQAYKHAVYPIASLTQDNVIGYNTSLKRDFLANIIWQPR